MKAALRVLVRQAAADAAEVRVELDGEGGGRKIVETQAVHVQRQPELEPAASQSRT